MNDCVPNVPNPSKFVVSINWEIVKNVHRSIGTLNLTNLSKKKKKKIAEQKYTVLLRLHEKKI